MMTRKKCNIIKRIKHAYIGNYYNNMCIKKHINDLYYCIISILKISNIDND